MKKLFFFIVFACEIVFSQPADINFKEEITLETVNVPSQEAIIFTLTSVGTCWANDQITQDYLVANETTYGNVTYNDHYGFRIFSELADPYEPFAHGLYRLISTESENYVFFDFRDCQFANQSGYPNYSTDFRIKYDASSNDFYYKDNNEQSYTLIPSKSLIQIWQIKNSSPITDCFFDFWNNCLVAIPEENSDSNQFYVPHLVWGPKPNYTASGYKVYRS